MLLHRVSILFVNTWKSSSNKLRNREREKEKHGCLQNLNQNEVVIVAINSATHRPGELATGRRWLNRESLGFNQTFAVVTAPSGGALKNSLLGNALGPSLSQCTRTAKMQLGTNPCL